ncbi:MULTISPECIES: ABC transporter permease [unclassified Leisingera]|uniref:ABC transporter permease n=1 Tax=unclassified Leisingera TaxID=2614906 RepID=UPI001011EFC0|nr:MULTISPECIES: ABC transporter permease [unclassified Leisingera]MBQ4826006.1 ABC transporter permease [Leisingera sp. HS039]MCF6432802.1 ABC transporter permease [Leisingera sp. MMG026]QAX31858.1 ABC transporter permease [Leisingera sp. NJS204]QBR38713.1 ABC transporter permease [Leisingera sp. NJS201]
MTKSRSELGQIIHGVARDPLGLMGLIIVGTIVFCAVFAIWIVPYDPVAMNIKDRLQGPSAAHILGTDQLGRDTFSRVVMGGQVALKVALPAVFGAMAIGLTLGMIAGYGPKWLDNLLMLFFDTIRSFPTVMFALAVVALVGPSLQTVVVVVMATSIPTYGRVARTQTLTLRNSEFILAERSMGASMKRILGVHMLPNIVGVLAVLAAMDIPTVIALEAGLSFLGLGVKPPTPSWGALLKDGYSLIRQTPWLVVGGGLPIILATLGFTFLGESLRDVVDPKLRKQR